MFKTSQIFILITHVLWWQNVSADTSQEKKITSETDTTKAFSIGESVTWHANTLNQERTINVYLPQSYHSNSKKTYPVIYLLDGSADEDFIHIAGLVQFGSFSWIKMLQESIVVGIANVDRKHDMTYPTSIEADKKEFPTTGGSAAFIAFIDKELKPLVKRKYRTQEENNTLVGQSLGGLLASEILFKHPGMFNNYLIVSPSLWWDNGSLLDSAADLDFKNKSIFIAVGKEGPIMESSAKNLFEKLLPHRSNQNRIEFQFFEKLDHGDTLHQAAYAGFEYLFKTINQETAH